MQRDENGSQRGLGSARPTRWACGTAIAVLFLAFPLFGATEKTPAQKEAEAAEIAAFVETRKAFEEKLGRVDEGLRKNPKNVPYPVLESCRSRRRLAVRLFQIGQHARADRRLDFCLKTMRIPEAKPETAVAKGPTLEEQKAKAATELDRAVALAPDLERGLEIWRQCAACHRAEGWGLPNGSVPQLAGQHRTVILKQLTDIRAGSRENALMLPYAAVDRIGDAQSLSDVAGYIDTLEISVATQKGSGEALDRGEQLYVANCSRCHGAMGEGDGDAIVPRIQSQHYSYLMRQIEAIRDGKRRNAHPEMKALIETLEEPDLHAVLDYVSRLEPPEELQAPPDWQNPDFAE